MCESSKFVVTASRTRSIPTSNWHPSQSSPSTRGWRVVVIDELRCRGRFPNDPVHWWCRTKQQRFPLKSFVAFLWRSMLKTERFGLSRIFLALQGIACYLGVLRENVGWLVKRSEYPPLSVPRPTRPITRVFVPGVHWFARRRRRRPSEATPNRPSELGSGEA